MKVYFAGAEISIYQRLMETEGAQNRGLSFSRIFQRPGASYILPEAEYWLDHGLSVSSQAIGDTSIEDFLAAYIQFAKDNADQIAGVNELDFLPPEEREVAWETIHAALGDKAQKMWDVADGRSALTKIASKQERFVVVGHKDIHRTAGTVAQLSKLSSAGHKIHIHVAPNISDLVRIRPTSVSTLTWASILRFGDLVTLHKGAVKTSHSPHDADVLHRASQCAEGFGIDPQLIRDQDSDAFVSLAFAVLSSFEGSETGVFLGKGESVSSTEDSSSESDGLEKQSATRRTQTPLPGMSRALTAPEDGSEAIPVMTTTGESHRQCNSCVLAQTCPAFKEESSCAFNMPVALRTPEQYAALVDSLCEMQTARVMFGRFAEEINGDSLDPDVGREADRLMKMLQTKSNLERQTESLSISVEASKGGGILSALFGKDGSTEALPPQQTRPDAILGEISVQRGKNEFNG